MAEIIPSINAPTFEEVQERIKQVEPYVSWCHLDVTDGIFSAHETWRNPADLARLDTKLRVEMHLMIAEPETAIGQWFASPIRRVIVHVEAMRDPELIINTCRAAGIEVGFAVNPDTFWGKLQPWFGKVDLVQALVVPPGPSGQEMGTEALDKVIHLRAACPRCIIEVDGGINFETAPQAAASGADLLIAGSAIFHSPNIQEAIATLQSYAASSRG